MPYGVWTRSGNVRGNFDKKQFYEIAKENTNYERN